MVFDDSFPAFHHSRTVPLLCKSVFNTVEYEPNFDDTASVAHVRFRVASYLHIDIFAEFCQFEIFDDFISGHAIADFQVIVPDCLIQVCDIGRQCLHRVTGA